VRQADRKQEILKFWRDNVIYNKQNNRAQATESALDGFDLVADIYIDIMSVDGFVSRTACHSLNQVSAWCFQRMSDAHGTTWPRGENSIERLYRNDPADTQEQENWLALRGLRLIYDLQTFLRAFRNRSPQLRKDCAMLVRVVADRCHREENACVPWRDAVGRAFWARCGDSALELLRDQFENRNEYVSDAALDASYDMEIRAEWRAINRIRDDDENDD
jgi:hypothetical protein